MSTRRYCPYHGSNRAYHGSTRDHICMPYTLRGKHHGERKRMRHETENARRKDVTFPPNIIHSLPTNINDIFKHQAIKSHSIATIDQSTDDIFQHIRFLLRLNPHSLLRFQYQTTSTQQHLTFFLFYFPSTSLTHLSNESSIPLFSTNISFLPSH